jgi:hypothetical protein
MNEEQEKMLRNMGALGYPIEKVISVMGIEDPNQFREEFADLSSRVRLIYKSGADLAEYHIDLKLFEMARSGDLKAMKELEIRKRKLANNR